MTRTVAVRLTAEVGSYITGMKNASRATRDLGSEVSREALKNREAWTEVGQGMIAFGAAAGVGVGMAVKRFADFDSAMSKVRAATHESARGMEQLRDAALEAGARTAFSASEAAEGIEALAKAGVSTTAILNGGLNGALDLAAAGGLAVGDAAEIAATALTQFSLQGSKVPHVADLLAAAAGKAQGDVSDMGMALKQAGLVANQTGLTIEETTAGLASFAAAGLIGSDAGTSFKSMLQRLTPQSAEAAGKMDELGISAYDAQGNFVGLEAFAGNLQTSLQGLTVEQRNSALATIFGSDAVRAAAVLYENGAQGVAEWTDKVNDAGYAQETAAIRLDNLKGDLEALGGSFETALIGSGSAANGVLREMTQLATGALNVYSALPGPVQATATGVGALAAVVGLAGGAFLLAVPKVAAFNAALGNMGPRTQAVGNGLKGVVGALGGPWGIALAGGVTALGIFGAAKQQARARVEEFTRAIEADSGAVGENARALAVRQLSEQGALRTAKEYGLSLDLVTDAALGNTAALERLRQQAGGFRVAATQATDTTSAFGDELGKFLGTVEKTAKATTGGVAAARLQAEALGKQAEAAGPAADGMDAVAAAATAAAAPVAELTEQQKALGKALESFVHPLGTYQELLSEKEAAERTTAEATAAATEDSKDSWEDYAEAATVSLGEFAAALEEDNKAHAEWKANLVRVAQTAGQDVALYLAEMGEEGVTLTAKFANGTAAETARAAEAIRQNMALGREGAEVELEAMAAMGAAKGKKTADQIAREVGIGADRVAAIAKQYGINLKAGIDPVLKAVGRGGDMRSITETGSGVLRRAAGGWVRGPGTSTSDSIPALLSDGEYVIRASAVQQYGGDFLDAVNAGRFALGGMVRRLASGGFANAAAVPRPPSVAPAGPPVSTAANGTMDLAYRAAVEAVKALAPQLMSAAGNGATGLNPQFLQMFNAYNAALGNVLRITSGWRSTAQQAVLYARYKAGVPGQAPAAPPGRSNHERGLAIDHSPHSTPKMRAIAATHGLRYPMSYEPWHVEPASIRRSRGGPVRRRFAAGGPVTGGTNVIPVTQAALEAVFRPATVALAALAKAPTATSRTPSGGAVSATRNVSLTTATRGMTDIAEIERVVKAWQDYNEQLDQAARKRELVADAQRAARAVAEAEAATRTTGSASVKATAAAKEAETRATVVLENAERRLGQAKTATAKENARAAVEEARRKLGVVRASGGAKATEAEAKAAKAATEELAQARGRLADANQAVKDFDFSVARDRESAAVERLIDRLEQEAETRKKLVDIRDEQKDRLNRMLDQEADARKRGVQAEQDYATAVERIGKRRAAVEQQFSADSARAARDLQAEQARILDGRRTMLEGWARLDQLAEVQWGYTVDQLLTNARDQAAQFEEWMAALASARQRGVSEQVISSLGLDEGPQALGQLRQFSAATVSEIDALNAEVARRTTLASAQTAREQQGAYGALGRELQAAQERYTQTLAELYARFQEAQAGIDEELTQAQADLMTRQAEVALQLAAIGQEQGRSYGTALAEGLRSQIPAVVAAAQALQAAAANAAAAVAAANPSAPAPTAANIGSVGSPGVSVPGAPPRGTPGQVSVNGQTLHVNAAGIIDTRGPYYGRYPAQVAKFDSGGWLQPGLTLAYNGTGKPERVLTSQQAAQQAAPPVVNVTAPPPDLSALLESNRQLTERVDMLQRTLSSLPQKQADLAYAHTR